MGRVRQIERLGEGAHDEAETQSMPMRSAGLHGGVIKADALHHITFSIVRGSGLPGADCVNLSALRSIDFLTACQPRKNDVDGRPACPL
jgi:hypothetical protein